MIDFIPHIIFGVPLVGILGYLLKILIEHFLTKDRTKQNRIDTTLNEASIEFREAFNDVRQNLDRKEHPVARLLHEFFVRHHQSAFTKFKTALKGKALRKLEKDWSKYEQFYEQNYNEHNEESIIMLLATAETEFEAQKRREYVKHIENLLRHAKIR